MVKRYHFPVRRRSNPRSLSTQSLLRGLWEHLSPRRRWQLPGLVGLMLASGLAEAVTLGAVLPFLGVIVAPEQIFDYPAAARLAIWLGLTTSDQLVLPLTVAFAMAALVAGALRLLVLWAIKNYVQRVGHELSVEVYRRTLYQPYQVHIARNSSEIISSVEKVNTVMAAVTQALTLTSATVMVTAIVLALVAVSPWLAATAFVGFGSLYAGIVAITRPRLARNSRIMSRALTQKIKALQEGMGGIRDVLLNHTQPFYYELYRQADWPFRQAKAENAFIAGSPRYGMEALGMVLIAAIAYGLSQQVGGGAMALPLLGTLALGAQRLLPAQQQMFAAWAFLRGDQGSAEDVMKLLGQPLPQSFLQPPPPPLEWHRAIEFAGVSFRYSEESPWVLQDISFTIPKGVRVGIIGTTGSGKSTTLDILMGLLEPSVGQVLVDGLSLQEEYCRAWQQTIAHVPQHIYLADTTLAENIALGVLKESIDLAKLKKAAEQAQISEFIESCPGGYWAEIGERGIRLSGGQRQRIGIARALYRQASVLIFDEATSALDNATEKEVMAAINGLGNDLTILVIAHRLSTVERCDWIVKLSDGKVVAQGRYQDFLEQSGSFKKIVTL
ncbi:ABC transporter ATP-binding protein [Leptolyngbya sp. KIOST-1]|uniref:ABC transporter ATP-binding protein n=1 Tax=Leptolyngbya sp. KIOST-1 TaxID=1229172 RepID=UPI0009079E1A|nr:ABC transporter ATP-binding protein [Leptolyngbya sp. KIOST-1]